MYCGQESLVKSVGSEVHGKVLRCRSWKCTECAPGRRKRLIAEGIGGNPTTFITLTLRADDPRPRDEQVKALSRAWRVIRQRICRRWKVKRIPFLAVVERTQAGTPHLHILTRVRYIDQRILSFWAGQLLEAPIVDIRRIDAHRGIARYVAKYVGKDPEQFGTCKRYWQSPDYDQRPDPERSTQALQFSWTDKVKQPLHRLVRDFVACGLIAEWRSIDRVILRPPPEGWPAGVRRQSNSLTGTGGAGPRLAELYS